MPKPWPYELYRYLNAEGLKHRMQKAGLLGPEQPAGDRKDDAA